MHPADRRGSPSLDRHPEEQTDGAATTLAHAWEVLRCEHPNLFNNTNQKEIKNMEPIDAFDLALDLAITADTQDRVDRAVKLAEEIAMQLTPEQVEQVKSRYEMGEYE